MRRLNKNQHLFIGRVLSCIFYAAVILFVSVPAFAEELSPQTQTSFEKGMAAAKQNEWDLAIKYFSQVTDANPYYSPAYFNLGLAHQKKGQSLPALAWFHAYVHHVPDDKEATMIRKEITALEVAVEAKIAAILKQAVDMAAVLPEKTSDYRTPQADAMMSVLMSFARSGSADEAAKLGTQYSSQSRYSFFTADYLKSIYVGQLVSEDQAELAAKVAGGISGNEQTAAYGELALDYLNRFPASADDIERALGLIAKMPDPGQWSMIGWAASYLIRAGRSSEAISLWKKITDPKSKFEVGAKIAEQLAQKGKTPEANEVLDEVRPIHDELTKSEPDKYREATRCSLLCGALVAAGKKEEAASLARSAPLSELPPYIRFELYLKLGDFKKAESEIPLMDNQLSQDGANQRLFNVLFESGRVADAEEHLKSVPLLTLIPSSYAQSYAKIAFEKLKNKDRAGFEKIASALQPQQPTDKPGQFTNRDTFNMVICQLAAAAGDTALFEEYYGKIEQDYFKKDALWAAAQASLDKNQMDRAIELLDRLREIVEKNKLYNTYKDLAALYGKAGKTDAVKELRQDALDISWIDLARSFEKEQDTLDPESYFKKIQSVPAEQLPEKTADLAVAYAVDLRKISRLDAELSK